MIKIRDQLPFFSHRYAQDCNNDGIIDCSDFGAIHYLGGFGCSGQLPFGFKSILNDCISPATGETPRLDVRKAGRSVKRWSHQRRPSYFENSL